MNPCFIILLIAVFIFGYQVGSYGIEEKERLNYSKRRDEF
jgi:hypothetical protein